MQWERGSGRSAEVKVLALTTALKGCGTRAISEGTLPAAEVPPEAPSSPR